MQEHFAALAREVIARPAAAAIPSSSKSAATTARCCGTSRPPASVISASSHPRAWRRRGDGARRQDDRRVLRCRAGAGGSWPNTATPTRSSPRTRCRTSPNLHDVVEGIEILLARGRHAASSRIRIGATSSRRPRSIRSTTSTRRISRCRHCRGSFDQHGLAVVDAIRFRRARRIDALCDRPTRLETGLVRAPARCSSRSSARACISRDTSTRFATRVLGTGAALMALLAQLQGGRQTRRRLRRDVEEHDDDQLLRHHSGPRRVHQRHDAGQARHLQPRRAYPGAAAQRFRRALSRSRVVVLVEPRR